MSAEVPTLFTKTVRVRFTQPSALNDPFELRPLIDFEGAAMELNKVVNAKIKELGPFSYARNLFVIRPSLRLALVCLEDLCSQQCPFGQRRCVG
jgi:hypothetical protein